MAGMRHGPAGNRRLRDHCLPRGLFMPKLFDNNSIEQWQAGGSIAITARARDHAKKRLSDDEEPQRDEGVNAVPLDCIARRKPEIPAGDALTTEY